MRKITVRAGLDRRRSRNAAARRSAEALHEVAQPRIERAPVAQQGLRKALHDAQARAGMRVAQAGRDEGRSLPGHDEDGNQEHGRTGVNTRAVGINGREDDRA